MWRLLHSETEIVRRQGGKKLLKLKFKIWLLFWKKEKGLLFFLIMGMVMINLLFLFMLQDVEEELQRLGNFFIFFERNKHIILLLLLFVGNCIMIYSLFLRKVSLLFDILKIEGATPGMLLRLMFEQLLMLFAMAYLFSGIFLIFYGGIFIPKMVHDYMIYFPYTLFTLFLIYFFPCLIIFLKIQKSVIVMAEEEQ